MLNSYAVKDNFKQVNNLLSSNVEGVVQDMIEERFI